MSYGEICKHCRYYRENHVDVKCSNGKFELWTVQDQFADRPELIKIAETLSNYFSGVSKAETKKQIQEDFKRGIVNW